MVLVQADGNKSLSANDSLVIDEFEETVAGMEDSMKSFMDNIVKQLMPHAIRIGLKSKASITCLVDLSNIVTNVKKLNAWAIRMMDAIGKPSGGILEGTSTALGDYDECLDIKYDRITGEYCLLEIKPPGTVVEAMKDYQVNKGRTNHSMATTKSFLGFLQKVRTNPDHVIFRLGICVPSSCTKEGIQSILELAAGDFDIPIEVAHCEHKSSFHFTPHQTLIITFIVFFVVLVMLGTFISIIRTYHDESPQSPSIKAENSNTETQKVSEKSFLQKLEALSRLSLCQNTRKLLNYDSEEDATDVVRGIKVLTVIFAIFAHTYALPHPLHLYRFRNTFNFTKFIDEVLFGAVANSSVGVDTFFFLAGFYFVYNRWRLTKRPNIFPYILKFISVMFIRMIAIQILVGSLFFLLPTVGSGPLWPEFVEGPLNNCIKSWWRNLLFIQNFLGPYDICLYPTWIFATMMQIFLITAAIVYVMHRWPVYGIITNLLTLALAMIGICIVTGIANYPATLTIYFYDYRTSIYFWKYFYTQFYAHIGPQCIGMLTAYFLSEYPLRKIDKRFVIPLWIICIVTISSIIFGLHSYRDGQEMVRGLAIFYAAVHRPAFAMALAWMVYACCAGHGGIINSLLTLKAFIPLERLCYIAYMLHIPIMYYQGGIQRERMFMGHYNQVMCFISYTVASFALAFVCYLFFQVPYDVVEGLFFSKSAGNIWGANPVTVSQDTLKTNDEEKASVDEETQSIKSKVLFNRKEETERF
ncbi:nose resistant to fluoxetine protein 6 [Caerostris darwini]|uniref:Nose resistant to fluoxetine protein 6 n=1 Tax=Caerostris darwini TaxID=1538125 RepID=A0AAV4NSW7_9ARAC|nr:nose resistant to fluoxetine protein 6 [Caerostris darwini]